VDDTYLLIPDFGTVLKRPFKFWRTRITRIL
jgi:hypothetical protein